MSLRTAVAETIVRAFGGQYPAAPPAPPVATTTTASDPRRRRRNKRISPQPVTLTRWLQKDVENAQHMAGQGDLSLAGQLYRAFQRDGMVQGLLGTRGGGLIRLPKRFSGHPDAMAYLQGTEGKPGRFNAIFPPSELAQLDIDGIVLGVGVAEFLEFDGLDYPVLVRLDPEFLRYRWYEDRWYYQALEGLLPITPGDGRWVLHTPGGRHEPWNRGLWPAVGRSFVAKEHAFFYRENWNGKLANPARYARAPIGASEPQRQGFIQRLIAWGVNTVFELPPGWEVGLLESNGRGYESFKETIADSNQEYMVAIAGQMVTVTGGAGFANANIHATIRSDLIQGDGEGLASTLNTQALPYALEGKVPAGAEAFVGWDTRPPVNLKEEAESLSAAATAVDDCKRVFGPENVDVASLAARFTVPIRGDLNGDAQPEDEVPQENGPPPNLTIPASLDAEVPDA